MQILYSSGARKIVVFDLGPMGCLPALRDLEETRSCSAPVSAVAAAHNDAVKGALSQLGQFLPGLTIVTTNFYKFFSERLENPSQYGESLRLCLRLFSVHSSPFSQRHTKSERDLHMEFDPLAINKMFSQWHQNCSVTTWTWTFLKIHFLR